MGAVAEASGLAREHMGLVRERFTQDTSEDHVAQVATKHLTGLPYPVAVGDDDLNWREAYTVWELQIGKELADMIAEQLPEQVKALREMRPYDDVPEEEEEPTEEEVDTLVPLLKEIFWLAWQACGAPAGMGVLQDRPNATKDDVWATVTAGGHDMNRLLKILPQQGGEFDADYIFGRMMKLTVTVKPGGTVEMPSQPPNPEYQGWARAYKSYNDLLAAAISSL